MTRKISDRMIRAMPYESRLKHYDREKNELFMKKSDVSAAELAKAHEELARKWMV